MKYHCKTVSLTQLMLTHKGVAAPLCNSCKTKDCSHHIEKRSVSVYGVNKDWRMLIKGGSPAFVAECLGYT